MGVYTSGSARRHFSGLEPLLPRRSLLPFQPFQATDEEEHSNVSPRLSLNPAVVGHSRC